MHHCARALLCTMWVGSNSKINKTDFPLSCPALRCKNVCQGVGEVSVSYPNRESLPTRKPLSSFCCGFLHRKRNILGISKLGCMACVGSPCFIRTLIIKFHCITSKLAGCSKQWILLCFFAFVRVSRKTMSPIDFQSTSLR